MLDSGAFSAWRKQEPIAIDGYIEFIKECKPLLWQYVALDCIPGGRGRPRTIADVDAAAAQSFRNLQIMRDAGLGRALGVFHQGERIAWLERMLADGHDYVGVSTAKNYPRPKQQAWLDIVFSVLTDGDGRPLARVHGFGSVHYDWLQRYPFASVDSAGWVKGAVFGKTYVPRYRDSVPDYLGDEPDLVTISGRYQKSRYAQRRQLANPTYYSPQRVEDICHFITHECGLTLEQVRSEPSARAQVMATYYERMRAALPTPIRFQHKVPLRGEEVRVARRLQATRSAIELPPLTFVFATQKDQQWIRALAAAGARHHLLSYWHLKERPGVLASYLGLEDAGPPCR
jgi:hypothetical protein